MAKLNILVATHKPYDFPNVDYYVPIHVGKTNSTLELGIQSDDIGENISEKNTSFCELTALYWAWKNDFWQNDDYVGLVHYRRYFKGKRLELKAQKIASKDEILNWLSQHDCLVIKKRNYYIETIYSHYQNAHNIRDLDCVRVILSNDYSDYLNAFDTVMSGKSLHLYNMFIMKKELAEQYCRWLFSILFKLEKEIDISKYDSYQIRVFGFLAERLFNVWLLKNKIRIKELPVANIEREKICLKAFNFLKRKFIR